MARVGRRSIRDDTVTGPRSGSYALGFFQWRNGLQRRGSMRAAAGMLVAGALGFFGVTGPSWAQTDKLLALAAQRQCLGCHQVDDRRVGPPFRAIAQRFQGQPRAADYLARVMRQGSSGQWGAIPMPAQSRLSGADALRLAQWILSLAPQPVAQDNGAGEPLHSAGLSESKRPANSGGMVHSAQSPNAIGAARPHRSTGNAEAHGSARSRDRQGLRE